MFTLKPQLEKDYGTYFATAALSLGAGINEMDRIEFQIVPTVRLHIDALLRLGKYVQ